MLDAGKLRHRLAILAPTSEQDSDTGEMQVTWFIVATVWGSFEPYSTKEFIAAATTQVESSARAVIRYRTDVISDMRIVCLGKLYEIVGPPLPDNASCMEYLTLMLARIEEEVTIVPTPEGYLQTDMGFVRTTLSTDGEETSFTFEIPFINGSLLVYINGILATPNLEYTEKEDNAGIDFVSAPAVSDVVEVFYAKVI